MIKLFLMTGLSFFSPRQDSIGIEIINGKTFIIHRVDERETLYGISKRYNVTVSQILEVNSSADAGLDIGQILKVPYVPKPKPVQGVVVHRVAEKETLYSISRLYNVSVDELKKWNNLSDNALALGQALQIKPTQTITPAITQSERSGLQSGRTVHTVTAKETLFSISRQYGVTVQQLRDWNNLSSEELKTGQVLFVAQHQNAPDTPAVQPPATPVAYGQTEVIVKPREAEPVITISESVKDRDEVKEAGLAELIEGTEGNRKYLALHRTAPVGTILKVRNEMNNREVFVRVAGKLPDTAFTNKLIIKISKSAYDRLGAIDPRFRVEVTYYK
jgi:LysM repeat protein